MTDDFYQSVAFAFVFSQQVVLPCSVYYLKFFCAWCVLCSVVYKCVCMCCV